MNRQTCRAIGFLFGLFSVQAAAGTIAARPSDIPKDVLEAVKNAAFVDRIDLNSNENISGKVLKAHTIVFHTGCSARFAVSGASFVALYADSFVFQSPDIAKPCELHLPAGIPADGSDGAGGANYANPASDGVFSHPDGWGGAGGRSPSAEAGAGASAPPLPDLYIFVGSIQPDTKNPLLIVEARGAAGGSGGRGGNGGSGQNGGRGRDDEQHCSGHGGGGIHGGDGGDASCTCEPNGNGGDGGRGADGANGGPGGNGANGANIWLASPKLMLEKMRRVFVINNSGGRAGVGGAAGQGGGSGTPGGPGARRYCNLERGPGHAGGAGGGGLPGAKGKAGQQGIISEVEWRP